MEKWVAMTEPIIDKELVVVHTNERHSLLINPDTHDIVQRPTGDENNFILTVEPKTDGDVHGDNT